MNTAVLILLVVAFILAVLATIGIASRVNLLAAAFASYVLAVALPLLAALG